MTFHTALPHIMAVINFATVLALLAGYKNIRAGKRDAHMRCMKIAVGLGVAFLVLYTIYHLGAGLAKFGGEGLIRPVYFTILIIHIIAAAAAAIIVPITVLRALGGRFDAHKRIAFNAWKLWMFVALSGILVYVMTIHIWPYAGAVG
jgi:putative membrane protein